MDRLDYFDKTEEELENAIDAVGEPTRKRVLGHLHSIDYLYSISTEFGMSTSTVKHHLDILKEHGLIEQVGSGDYRKLYQATTFGEAIYQQFSRRETLPGQD